MKATTVKRLAILIIVLSVAGGAVFALERAQMRKLAGYRIKEAELAVEQKDFAKAESLYREYLQAFS